MQLTALLAIGTSYFFQHRAVAASSLNFTFGIGAIIGPNLGAAILGATHWKMPFIVFGLSGIVAFVLIVPLVSPGSAKRVRNPIRPCTVPARRPIPRWTACGPRRRSC